MKIITIIISLILIIINNNNLINCQLSPSNNYITLNETQYYNKYSSYGTLSSNYQQCSYTLMYDIVSNLTTPKVTGFSFLVLLNYNILEISINVPVSSDSSTYQFIIQGEDSNSNLISTNFDFTLNCESLDVSSLDINLISKNLALVNQYNYYSIFQVLGLKYELEDRIKFSSNLNGVSIKKMINNYYFISVQIYSVSDYINKSLEISILFPNRMFNFTLEPFLLNSDYQQIIYQTYPNTLSTSPFIEYGLDMGPLVIFSSNLTDVNPYFYILGDSMFSQAYKISQLVIGGILKYYYVVPLLVSYDKPPNKTNSFNYSLYYNNGPNQDSKIISIYGYKVFPTPSNITGQFYISTLLSNTFSFSFSSKDLYKGAPFLHSYYKFNSLTQFPYGFISGNNKEYNYSSSYSLKLSNGIGNTKNNFYVYEYPEMFGSFYPYANPSTNTTTDLSGPKVTLFELIQIVGYRFLLRIKLKDESVVYGFKILVGIYERFFSYESLVSVENGTWLFETPVDLTIMTQDLKTIDIYNNVGEFTRGHIMYIGSDQIPVYYTPLISPIELNIENITFLNNDVDILNKPNFNTVYFNSTTIPIDYPLSFTLSDEVTVGLTYSSYTRENSFIINYDKDKKLFYCDFIIPKNTNPGSIPYEINSFYGSYSVGYFESPLRVAETAFDNEGPIIKSIINANTFGKVGWRVLVTDTQNGFSNGYIKVIGSLDSSIFKFNFTIQNATLDSKSTIWRGEYDIILNISSKCVSQDYMIDYVYLEDSNKIFSKFTRHELYYKFEKNPLRNHLDNLEYYLKTSSKCLNEIQDNTPPELVSFKTSKLISTAATRKLSFDFIARDLESGLMETQKPIVYLQQVMSLDKIECESTIVSINNTHAEYYCELELPIGFGSDFSGGALISIYGFINNGGMFSGFKSDDEILYNSSFIEISYSFNSLLTGYEPYYLHSNSSLVLYGKTLGSTDSISITYSDGTNKLYPPTKIIGSSVLVIQRDDYQVLGPFDVLVTMKDGIKTNTITVYPIDFRSSENSTSAPETPTPTPTSTNENQKLCFDDPMTCGGPSKGYCDQDTGYCICYSPWMGNYCSSKVIIVPKPNFNETVPTTEIPIDDNESQVFYKSLISVVSLRELTINNSVLHEHKLERWIYSEVNSTVSQYYSRISYQSITNQSRSFEIYVTLKWYNNVTTVEFANQYFSMNPSSMKYAIDILDYPFESRLNRLQLVLQASLLSNKENDICSSKEFGDIASVGDNSNYIKIQVNNTSLYGRFIKRGIIDDRVITLSNELLDKEMNAINEPHQVQSYIGISIPWFGRHSIIDPDFSVLVDSSKASSLCSSNKSKLSAIQIAGIAIGCFLFITAITVSIIYMKYKSNQKKKFIKNIDTKLKVFNQ